MPTKPPIQVERTNNMAVCRPQKYIIGDRIFCESIAAYTMPIDLTSIRPLEMADVVPSVYSWISCKQSSDDLVNSSSGLLTSQFPLVLAPSHGLSVSVFIALVIKLMVIEWCADLVPG